MRQYSVCVYVNYKQLFVICQAILNFLSKANLTGLMCTQLSFFLTSEPLLLFFSGSVPE